MVSRNEVRDEALHYFLLILCLLAFPMVGEAQQRATIVLGTVGGAHDTRVNMVNGQLPDENPGWFIELSQRAANQCGADIDFVFMPWARVLKQIESGSIAGGFNSSYRPERAIYGVYPSINGVPDKRRSSQFYKYFAYAHRKTQTDLDVNGISVVAERNASIIPDLKKRGAKITEVASYTSMLRVVAAGRVSLAVGIGSRLDRIIEQDADLSAKLKKLKPPIFEKIGYVMFSKKFYATHGALVECFWDTSAQLRETGWFIDLRERYWQRR